jgi:hypothetical protein
MTVDTNTIQFLRDICQILVGAVQDGSIRQIVIGGVQDGSIRQIVIELFKMGLIWE